MSPTQLHHYFTRANAVASATPNRELLSVLQRSHAFTFPFENLFPLLNIPVLLDTDTLYNKMVVERRGGYCYEQNMLFLNVLRSLHFNVRGITGRVMERGKGFMRRTHMLLLVEINGITYVSDVGFGGDAPCIPLTLETNKVQTTPSGDYRLIADKKYGYILQEYFYKKWRTLYCFDLSEQDISDFEVGNWYTSTHPDSHFKKDLTASIKRNYNRYSLFNRTFSTYHTDGTHEKKVLKTVSEIREILSDVFTINLEGLPGLDNKLKEIIKT